MAKKKTFPTLYKKTATGAIQQWTVSVEGTTIATAYGQVGGQIQTTKDQVKSGKNLGRKNATAPEEQALKEAESSWLKKKKAGYVESFEDAESGKTDEIIKGGVVPMLASPYEKCLKVQFPAYVQPKLDGARCLCMVDATGKATLWSRTRKRITAVPHIEKEMERFAAWAGYIGRTFDGELYSHDLSQNFEGIMSRIRTKEPGEGSTDIKYHIYDTVSDSCFSLRLEVLKTVSLFQSKYIEHVSTRRVNNLKEVMDAHDKFVEEGYEGAIVRQKGSKYEHKRTFQLLKVKSFTDEEFKIIGVEEGRGKLIGHAGAFVCFNHRAKNPEDEEFRVKMSGELETLRKYWEDRDKYLGSLLTVKYQGLSSALVPRFPVGLRIREDL